MKRIEDTILKHIKASDWRCLSKCRAHEYIVTPEAEGSQGGLAFSVYTNDDTKPHMIHISLSRRSEDDGSLPQLAEYDVSLTRLATSGRIITLEAGTCQGKELAEVITSMCNREVLTAVVIGDNMKLDEYQTLAKQTAIYPGELVYPALGLCGEIGELLNALGGGDDDEIPKEIGDVLWYVANVAADAGLTLSEVMGRKTFPNHNRIIYANDDHVIDTIILAGGVVAENVKKTLRDDNGELCDRRRANIKKALKIIVCELNILCWNTCARVQLERCAKDNIEKLQSRQARGKLSGDGDNR